MSAHPQKAPKLLLLKITASITAMNTPRKTQCQKSSTLEIPKHNNWLISQEIWPFACDHSKWGKPKKFQEIVKIMKLIWFAAFCLIPLWAPPREAFFTFYFCIFHQCTFGGYCPENKKDSYHKNQPLGFFWHLCIFGTWSNCANGGERIAELPELQARNSSHSPVPPLPSQPWAPHPHMLAVPAGLAGTWRVTWTAIWTAIWTSIWTATWTATWLVTSTAFSTWSPEGSRHSLLVQTNSAAYHTWFTQVESRWKLLNKSFS